MDPLRLFAFVSGAGQLKQQRLGNDNLLLGEERGAKGVYIPSYFT
jgi:hypothetical protein